MKQDAFEVAEDLGRKKAIRAIERSRKEFFKDWDGFKIVPTTEKRATWDFDMIDPENNDSTIGIIEAKDRNMASTDKRILSDGAQLERQKYDKLLRICNEKNIPCFYVCTYTDGGYYIWDIEECVGKVTFDSRMCPATTAVKADKIEKKCCYFKVEDAFAKGTLKRKRIGGK